MEAPFERLLNRVGKLISELEDERLGNNKRYEVSDAVLSAFSVFFLQNPSFLSSQLEVQRRLGKNNAATIFGVHQIPSDNQIRNILDGIPRETLNIMAFLFHAILEF
jgi:hypothetical protein